MDRTALVEQCRLVLFLKQERSIKIYEFCILSQQDGGRYCQRRSDRAPDHDAEAFFPRRLAQSKGCGEPTSIIQLYIDEVVSLFQAGYCENTPTALVSTNRDWMTYSGEGAILSSR